MEGLLSPYRMLDLTDEKGFICGKVFGDLGADVIKVERPGGDPSRQLGPFVADTPDANKSLYWFAFNTSKRGITLNLEHPQGQEIFKRLVKTADFVVESFQPGYMSRLGLDYDSLSKVNPGVILTSISPFGQTGPYKDYKGPDLVAMAMSGTMSITGSEDRAPLRQCLDQAYCAAGSFAVYATLLANHWRQLTGEGQQVDFSMVEALLCINRHEPVHWQKLVVSKLSQEEVNALEEPIAEVFSKYTKSQLEKMGERTNAGLVPVRNIEDVVKSEHLANRDYWVELDHPELGSSLRYPGQFFLSTAAKTQARFRAPFAAEHNHQVYGTELSLSKEEIKSLEEAGVI